MICLCAFDKFKGTVSAQDACASVSAALRQCSPALQCVELPLSDGGEGFVSVLSRQCQLIDHTLEVPGPLADQLVRAHFAMSSSSSSSSSSSQIKETEQIASSSSSSSGSRLAIIEMASAAGLDLIDTSTCHLDPRVTTTRGVGTLIRHACELGARRIIVGVGGSATNDGGLGCLQALGVRVYLDGSDVAETSPISGGGVLQRVSRLEWPDDVRLDGATIEVACDVSNPFVGEHGAVAVFSAQKGADDACKRELEAGMINLAARYADMGAVDGSLDGVPGAGAAGGLAGGLVAIGATVRSGMELIADVVELERRVEEASLVITGEGAYDEQTEHGKVVSVVQRLAAKHRKPVIVLCGRSDIDAASPKSHNVFALRDHFALDECLGNTKHCIGAVVTKFADGWLAQVKRK
jgi:glycerate 2-kinase